MLTDGGQRLDGSPAPPADRTTDRLLERVDGAVDPIHTVYHLRIKLGEYDSDRLGSCLVRALRSAFHVLASDPPVATLADGVVERQVDALIATGIGAGDVSAAVEATNVVEGVDITRVPHERCERHDVATADPRTGPSASARFEALKSSIDDDATLTEDELEPNFASDDEEVPFAALVEEEPLADGPDHSPEHAAGDRPDPETMLAEITDAVERGAVDDETVAAFRSAVAPEAETSDRIVADHLKARVADLEAYTEALEAFLDENGRGDDPVGDLRHRLDAAERAIDRAAEERAATEETVAEVEATLDAVREGLRGVVRSVTDVREDVAALDERVDDVAGDVEATQETVTDVADDLETTRERVEEFQAWRRALAEQF